MALTPGELARGYGLRMAMGRDFLPSEGTPGNDHEIIISHKLWRVRYNSDSAIIGKTIMVSLGRLKDRDVRPHALVPASFRRGPKISRS